VRFYRRLPLQRLATAAVAGLVVTSLAVLVPAVGSRLTTQTQPTPIPTIEPTAPPAAVLLPEELARDLQGIMVLANERTFGTAFQIDPRGRFLTAASLVSGSKQLRLVDNTGGSHLVSVVGVDTTLGLAEVLADGDGLPLALGASGGVKVGDSLVILASAKVVNLRSATPAVVTTAGPFALGLRADDLPGEIGGPLVGPGGTVLGLLTGHGSALPMAAAEANIASWRALPGTLMPLAGLPADLVLRGSNTTTTPSGGASVQAITPARASTSQTTVVTLQGTGFVAGPSLSVLFVALASPSGSFHGAGVTFVNASVISVKVPAGATVQDYVVELTNGDGSVAAVRAAFTVTP
jgi:hypothetical protein